MSRRPRFTFLKSGSRITTRSSGKWALGGSDDGQVTILLIGFVVVALALVAVVASAAQVHLERTRLAALADLAALAAAEQVSDEAYFAPSDAPCPVPGAGAPGASAGAGAARAATSASAVQPPGAGDVATTCAGPTALAPADDLAAAVDGYLTHHPDAAARWTDLRVVEAGSPDGRTVRVTLRAVVRPAWAAWVLAPFTDGIAIGATSAARAW